MLNEWSDRQPPEPPRPFYARGEFWLAVWTMAVGALLLAGFAVALLW